MPRRSIGSILGESLILAFVISAIGFSFVTLWHALTGAPLTLTPSLLNQNAAAVAPIGQDAESNGTSE